MAFVLRPSSSLTGMKRTHSTDNSTSATPAQDTPSSDETEIPSFLHQSKSEIAAKFEDIGWQQQSRLDHGRASGDPDSPWTVNSSKEARLRDRYFDIRPWEKCRIKLKVPEGSSDYINASPIKLVCSKSGQERRYIATQGPKQTGVDHFWQMIWQETNDLAVIVMLTALAEGIREKCYQYYPPDADSPLTLTFATETGDPQPAALDLETCAYDAPTRSVVRKLTLTSTTHSKTVWHLSFLAWPDYGVPDTPADRLALLALQALSRAKNGGWDGGRSPRVVHCSAGVGRSGTFIALEHLLAELEAGALDAVSEAEDPVHDTVNVLREQRMTMVQSETQFAFLYDVLAEAWRRRRRGEEVFSGGEGRRTEAETAADVEGEGKGASAAPDVPPSEKLGPSGEPSPKAMRLSRVIKNILTDVRERSLSRQRGGEKDGECSEEAAKEVEKDAEKEAIEGKTP